jgi:lysyl-tRNA synthetase class 1
VRTLRKGAQRFRGSYDTSKVIVKELFGYDPPEPVLYEHILVDGQKMSKSLGNIVTLEEMLEVVKPEILRFFFFPHEGDKAQGL